MKNKSIICRIKGGLGNQMFIYAAAKHLAIKNNSILILDKITGFKYDKEYQRKFKLDVFEMPIVYASNTQMFLPFDKIIRRLKKIFSKSKFYDENTLDFDESFFSIKNNNQLWIEGYWQDERYFKEISNIIKTDFTFKDEYKQQGEKYYQLINENNSVAIHFRNFNINSNNNSICNLTNNYYYKSIEYINKSIEKPLFFIFAENLTPDQTKLIKDIKNKVLINTNSDVVDMYLMSLCKHFIIANSSFSWWAAWLSNYNNKIVISPKKKKIDKNSGFSSVTSPDRWITI